MDPRTPFAAAALLAAVTLAPVAAQRPPSSSLTQPQPPTQPQQQTAQLATQQPGAPQPATQPVGTTGQWIPTPSAVPCTPGDVSTALPLLDRVQRLLDAAIKDGLGKVELDRGTVDEMRAEIAQIRAAIQPVKP